MTGNQTLRVLAMSGSLRKGSYNTAVVRACAALAPDGMTFDILDLAPVPLFSQDVEAAGMPDAVRDARERIAAADGVLIATPEYNSSIPGVLKNALDWFSRPPAHPFVGKPLAIIGASPGRLGTARAQLHLRQIMGRLNAVILTGPEVLISGADQAIGEDGSFTDDATASFVRQLLADFASLIRHTAARCAD